jgi:hypothetical protein
MWGKPANLKGLEVRRMSKWLLAVQREPYMGVADWNVIEDLLSKMNGQNPSMMILRRKAKGELVIHGGNLVDHRKIYYVN